MSDVRRILGAIEQGDPSAAEQLLPLVYDELRQLAAQKLAQEKPGQMLDATALVHEAYLRLVDADEAQHWDSRGHFFAAAAIAMRRILVEHARGRAAAKRGGGRPHAAIESIDALDSVAGALDPGLSEEILAVDFALEKLAERDQRAARVVTLRYFGGLSLEEVAEALDLSLATVKREWTAARAWLRRELARP